MKRQNDPDLHDLLREWTVDDAPASLESRVTAGRHASSHAWWHVLIHGYIKVPVPVACGLVLLIILGAWRLSTHVSNGCRAESIAPSSIAAARVSPADPKSSSTTCILNSNC